MLVKSKWLVIRKWNFSTIKKETYVLDNEKIEEDKKYDGLYVNETSLTEVSGIDIIDIYSNQWK
ncbi:hypothetical protein RRG54_04095 [Mycoplasmopsis felis]|uniref:hypothetical protein n=1 Tax=Mycoplasmopsis felis TaxID=33923 RepID=UPI00300C8FAD